ncbi:MAG: hypothetical protein ACI4AD_07855 [Roseburia sp.]
MEDNTQLTPFDNMTCTRQLQMLKTMVPYMKGEQKKQFAILIKYMELQNTIQIFSQEDKVMSMCSVEPEGNTTLAMLNELRRFCTEKEQETLDMIYNMFSMMETYETIFM